MPRDLILIDRVPSQLEADIIRGMLMAQDIDAHLSRESAASAIGLNIGPMSQVEIYVLKKDVQRARELLREYHAGAGLDDRD